MSYILDKIYFQDIIHLSVSFTKHLTDVEQIQPNYWSNFKQILKKF